LTLRSRSEAFLLQAAQQRGMGQKSSKARKKSKKEAALLANRIGEHLHTVLHVVSARGIPREAKSGLEEIGDPYVVVTLLDDGGSRVKGWQPVKDGLVRDTQSPTFDVLLLLDHLPSDQVKLELFDDNYVINDCSIGTATVTVADLLKAGIDGAEFAVDLTADKSSKVGGEGGSRECFLCVGASAAPAAKTTVELFMVRHGESTWNKGEDERDMVQMLKEVDHPLTKKGIGQAERFRDMWTEAAAAAAASLVCKPPPLVVCLWSCSSCLQQCLRGGS
jgi:hypothetical protein